MDNKLKKGIIIVFVTNIINLAFSLATNFLLPKYLAVETYAGIKTYQLYLSYIGLLHFGYVDGIYLQFGGKEISKGLNQRFANDIWTMRTFELLVTMLFLALSMINKDFILLCFALSILPINMCSYYKYLYQATGNFSRYGRIINFSAFAGFVLNICIIFLLKLDNAHQIIALYLSLYVFIWLVLEAWFHSLYKVGKPEHIFSFSSLKNNVGLGFFLTVGNLASIFLSSMDRWFVKFLLDTFSFAMYSFAVSIDGFLNIAITPVTTTLYNFFCRERDVDKYRTVFKYLVVFATILPCLVFPVKFVLKFLLQKYMGATSIIVVLFSAKIFIILINSVFVNLYKVEKQQKKYFLKLVSVLILGFGLNVIFYYTMGNNLGFAIGTLLSSVTWFTISYMDFRYLKIELSVFVYLATCTIFLIVFGCLKNTILGFFLYLASIFLFGKLLMNQTYSSIYSVILLRVRAFINRT